jgi:hypothetical protein
MGKLLVREETQPFISLMETGKAYVTTTRRKSDFRYLMEGFAVSSQDWTLNRSLWQNGFTRAWWNW